MVASEADRLRARMVEEQLVPRGITDADVLAAMRAVPRHLFVPRLPVAQAYADRPQRIGQGQTISQPYIVAWTAQLLELGPGDHVLDVGTGCGYAAAVLAHVTGDVTSIERHEELATSAAERLATLGVDGVTVVVGDGALGVPGAAPFDAVAVAAAAAVVPPALVDQLADGGRLVLPVGSGRTQDMVLVRRDGERTTTTRLGAVRFVPLVTSDEPDPAAGGRG